jgi:hypothetical protein
MKPGDRARYQCDDPFEPTTKKYHMQPGTILTSAEGASTICEFKFDDPALANANGGPWWVRDCKLEPIPT